MTKLHWLALAFAMNACGGDEHTVALSEAETGSMTFTVTPLAPVARGANTFSLDLDDHGPASKIAVSAWMPSMGHGAPGTPAVVQVSSSRYRIEGVMFSMPGTWELRVDVTCALGSGQRTFRYEVP